jgi:hypothetical protein
MGQPIWARKYTRQSLDSLEEGGTAGGNQGADSSRRNGYSKHKAKTLVSALGANQELHLGAAEPQGERLC